LQLYPRARAYLECHRARLASREYLRQSDREWYEVWVPQDPAGWAQPKVVFPDIAEYPRFMLDDSTAIVNGDCYWITLQHGRDARWLLLLLAVANSSFILKYYDTVYHNKLYSGRRRFMTQYVKGFPLPDLNSPLGNRLVALVSEITSGGLFGEARAAVEKKIDAAVWESFGLVEEAAR
jgi:adenine-specific DNA-methyltransferase